MKQSHQCVAMAGLLAVVLAITGCAAKGGAGDLYSEATSSRSDEVASSRGDVDRHVDPVVTSPAITSATAGTSGSQGATDSGSARMQDERGDQPAAAARTPAPNGTVLSIAPAPAPAPAPALAPNGVSKRDASMGASGTAGTSGSGGASQSYRVTVRMDDGITEVITYTGTPDFRRGERINVADGAILR